MSNLHGTSRRTFQNQPFTTLFRNPSFGRQSDDSSSSRLFCLFALASLSPSVSAAQQNSFHVLAFHTDKGEPDHIDFAKQGLAFFTELGKKNDFHFEVTTHWKT